MSLVSFLNNLFKDDGFELIDSNSKRYVIGKTKKQKSKAKRSEIRTKAFEETKLLNFFNVEGIVFRQYR